jgi:hypothetical protein
LVQFPAGIALRWFAPPNISFAGVAGTLWSGSAATCSVEGFTVEGLRWDLRPISLLVGRLSADVEARIPDGFVSGNVAASPSSVSFSGVRAATSLPALAGILPVRGLRGQANVALEQLVLENGWPATAVGDGSGAYVPLGDYTVSFVPAPEGQLAATFVDNGGPLEVNGTVSLDTQRVYMIDALVEPRAGANAMLVEGLKIMSGEPDAEGRRRFNLSGSL